MSLPTAPAAGAPRLYVFFGKSCAGKSYVAGFMAAHLKLSFLEGDAFLTAAMKHCIDSGQPFTDDVRDEYYRELGSIVRAHLASHAGVVVAHAFFRRRHRELFRALFPGVRFVFVDAPERHIEHRATHRRQHAVTQAGYVAKINTMFEAPHDEAVVVYENIHEHVDCAGLTSALAQYPPR
jgi:carbohydrate kinase (thermoresistant glucokinase family)